MSLGKQQRVGSLNARPARAPDVDPKPSVRGALCDPVDGGLPVLTTLLAPQASPRVTAAHAHLAELKTRLSGTVGQLQALETREGDVLARLAAAEELTRPRAHSDASQAGAADAAPGSGAASPGRTPPSVSAAGSSRPSWCAGSRCWLAKWFAGGWAADRRRRRRCRRRRAVQEQERTPRRRG